MRVGGLLVAAAVAALVAPAGPVDARTKNKDVQLASLPENPVIEQADPVVRGVLGAVGRGLDYVRAECCAADGEGCC